MKDISSHQRIGESALNVCVNRHHSHCSEFCHISINQRFRTVGRRSFGATTNPETGAAINKRTSKIGIR